jgi:hypothetical protein
MLMANDDFPSVALAYREYALVLAEGVKITLAITLGGPEADTQAAQFAREHEGLAYGLISILDMPDAPRSPIVWVVTESHLILAKAEGDPDVSEELEQLIGCHLGLFFVQTAPFAPQLAGIEIQPVGVANDNHTVH